MPEREIRLFPLEIRASKRFSDARPDDNGKYVITWDWGESSRRAGTKVDPLGAMDEPAMVQELIRSELQLDELIRSQGVAFPRCWIALQVPVRRACPSWPETKPGDLDLVFGPLLPDGEPDFRTIYASEIKVRRIRSDGSVGKLSSGRGTGQTRLLAEMGFDAALLTHLLIRIPDAARLHLGNAADLARLGDWQSAIHRTVGALKAELTGAAFGYAFFAIAHPEHSSWTDLNATWGGVLVDAPLRPFFHRDLARQVRQELATWLQTAMAERPGHDGPLPFVWTP